MADPQGLAFDTFAEDYDLGRPPWPAAMLDGLGGGTALDLASGTGKLTALLAERFARVVAVEPLPGMRAVLARNVPAADVRDGSAERIPLPDASVDAAFVAEAFHWFDSAKAAAELARVLRPGAPVLVCFNSWLGLEPELPDEFERVLWEAQSALPAPGGPKAQSGLWQEGFSAAPFAPFHEEAYRHEWMTTAESIVAFYVSISSMGALPPDERLALRARLLSLLPDVPYRFDIEARVFRTVRR